MSYQIATPVRLQHLHSPPKQLYLEGNYDPQLIAVAIVGSRNSSSEGLHIAKKLAAEVAGQGMAVISGLARGIDRAAHEGAIQAGGKTYAVLPSGIDNIYPASHIGLARKIINSGGLISEYLGDYRPNKYDFLKRNRIISGLADVVVVVEAAARSGALNTARHALEQGRELAAVPGSILSPYSKGTNDLIRQGATPVTSAEDIFSILGFSVKLGSSHTLILEDNEKSLVDALGDTGMTLDQLVSLLETEPAKLSALITKLEIEGIVGRAEGNYVFRRQ